MNKGLLSPAWLKHINIKMKKQQKRHIFYYRKPPQNTSKGYSGRWLILLLVLALLTISGLWVMVPVFFFRLQKISGKVVDYQNFPIKNVQVDFLDRNFLTDSNGEFFFIFPPKDSIAFLSIHYPNSEVLVTRKVNMDGYGALDFLIVFSGLPLADDGDNVKPAKMKMKPDSVKQDKMKTTPSDLLAETENRSTKEKKTLERESSHLVISENENNIQVDLNWDSFIEVNKTFSERSFFLMELEIYFLNGKRYFAGVWRLDKNESQLWLAKGWKSFLYKEKELRAKGFRLIDLEVYLENKQPKFAGIWKSGISVEQRLWGGGNWNKLLEKRARYAKKNFLLIDVETYPNVNQRKYVGVWQKARSESRLWRASRFDKLLKKVDEYQNENTYLIDLEIFQDRGQEQYLGIWYENIEKHRLWFNAPWKKFLSKNKEYHQEKLYLIDLEILLKGGTRNFSGIWGSKKVFQETFKNK